METTLAVLGGDGGYLATISMASLDALISEIETQWEQLATKAIADKIAEHPSERFYAAGFWLFYCDYTVIHPPCLGMNTESHLAKSPDDAKYSRWSPPNWQFDVLDGTTDVIMSEYKPLHGNPDDPTWEQIIEDHKQAIARVCRRVTATARNRSGLFEGLTVHPMFVVGIFEERDGDEEYGRLAELSIKAELFCDLDVPIG